MKKSNLVKRAWNVYKVNVSKEKTLKNMISKIKSHVNTKQFNVLYNSIIPFPHRNRFRNSARANLLGKSKGEIQNRLRALRANLAVQVRSPSPSPSPPPTPPPRPMNVSRAPSVKNGNNENVPLAFTKLRMRLEKEYAANRVFKRYPGAVSQKL
jgi:hypothetical protein